MKRRAPAIPPVNIPPRGWTVEADRREEFADLSALAVLYKAGRQGEQL